MSTTHEYNCFFMLLDLKTNQNKTIFKSSFKPTKPIFIFLMLNCVFRLINYRISFCSLFFRVPKKIGPPASLEINQVVWVVSYYRSIYYQFQSVSSANSLQCRRFGGKEKFLKYSSGNVIRVGTGRVNISFYIYIQTHYYHSQTMKLNSLYFLQTVKLAHLLPVTL